MQMYLKIVIILGTAFWGAFAAWADPTARIPAALSAKQVIMTDLSTDTVVYEKNADQLVAPSSMTKIVVLYDVFDRLKQGRLISARDLSLIAKKTIDDFPQYWHFYAQKAFAYGGIRQRNQNPFLFQDDLVNAFLFKVGEHGAEYKADGMKGGFTDAGGYGLIGSFWLHGHHFLFVFNGCRSKKERAQNALALVKLALFNLRRRQGIVNNG